MMIGIDDTHAILNRIVEGQITDTDLNVLRQLLNADQNWESLQLGKYNINIDQGKDIHIGDRIYQGTDADKIKELLEDLLQEHQLLPDKSKPIQVWRYLHTLTSHKGAVNALIIAPDGKTLISASDDHTIKVWSLSTMKLLREFSKGYTSVTELVLSPDGKTLVSGSAGGTIKIWKLDTGELVHALNTVHQGTITALAISPDSRTLVTAGMDKMIKIWDLQTKQPIQTFFASHTFIKAITVSPDGKLIITGSQGKTLKFWKLETGEVHNILSDAHTDSINHILIRPGTQELITASSDKTMKIWNWNTQELLYTLDKSHTPILSMAISQDGSILISGSEGGTAKFWDLETRELIYLLDSVHYSRINALAITPNAQMCVTGSKGGIAGGNIKVWRKDGQVQDPED